MHHMIPLCLIALVGLVGADPPNPQPADGLYDFSMGGEGPQVLKSNGQKVRLGPFGGAIPTERSIVSEANDNSRFIVSLMNIQPGIPYAMLLIDGIAMTPHGQSQGRDGTRAVSFKFEGLDRARKFAAKLNCPLQLRTNPGRPFEATWSTDKAEYRVGEPIIVTMELRNVSNKIVAFLNGGKQRGMRNNQFRFLAYRAEGHGTAVPDTGDPTHFGGICSNLPIDPGESIKLRAELGGWFKFTEQGVYRISGMFELELHDPARKVVWNVPIWDDLAAGDFLVRIVPATK